MRTSIIMVSFYFLLLIPLISALRRVDVPDQFNVLRGNKPILRMALNEDDSELRSGSFRPHKKHHHQNKKHQLRNKKAILGEDSAHHVVHTGDVDDSRGKTFTFVDFSTGTESSESRESKETSKSSKTKSDSPGFLERFVTWIASLQGNNSFIQVVPKHHVLNLTSNKHTRHRNTHVNVTTERPYVKYVHQEHGGVLEKLWLLFVGNQKFPNHIFGSSGRSLQVYEGFKKDGKLVLRKANKDIDISELEDGKLVLPKAFKDIDLSEINPDIIYYQ